MYKWLSVFIVVFIVNVGSNVFAENLKPYPKTRKVDVVDDYFGVKVKDPYRWLENTKSKEVQDWIEAQNKYTDEYMKNIPQVKKLLERLKKHDAYDEDSIPTRVYGSKRIFFWRKLQGKDKRMYCMKEDKHSKAIVLIDPNKWAEEELLGKVTPSHNGKYLVYEKSKGGNEVKGLCVLECDSKCILEARMPGYSKGMVYWYPDNSGFFYSAFNKPNDYTESIIYFHQLLENKNEKIFPSEKDKIKYIFSYAITSRESKSHYFIIKAYCKNGKEDIYYKNIANKNSKIVKLFSDISRESYLQIINNDFYFLEVSDIYKNGTIFKLPEKTANRAKWQIIVPENKNKTLNYFNSAYGKLIVNYFENAHTKIDIYSTNGEYEGEIPLPMLCTADMYSTWNSEEVYLSVKSFVVRNNYYVYNLKEKLLELTYSRLNTATYTSQDIVVKQIWYKSKGGTKISMFLTYKKKLKLNANNPVFMYAYGSNAISITPFYYLTTSILVENGGIFCVPNLRGGGEYGYKWHKEGMGRKKQNTINDFVYATKWLIDHKYTNPQRIAIMAESAGSLPIAGAITQYPELYKVTLLQKPVLDMIRYNKINPTKMVIKEYGDPENEGDFKVLYSYSPYHHVSSNKQYPSVFLVGAENDVRVGVGSVLKMGASLQNSTQLNLPILIQVEKDSGHVETASKKESFKYLTQQYGFLFNQIGVEIK